MGSREGIYDYIIAQFEKGISVHVILMEMIGVVSEHQIFQPLHQLTRKARQLSSSRVAAEIVLVGTQGIAPHDIHEDNAFGTMDGKRTTIIDLGGILVMSNENDVHELVSCFDIMCDDERYKITSSQQDEQNLLEFNGMPRIDDPTEREKHILMIMKPSLEQLCLFLEVDMTLLPKITTEKAYRQQLKNELVKKFRTEIQECFANFKEEGPTVINVHFRLMILALIDFLYNRIALNHPYCRSRQILEDVYPVGQVMTSIGISMSVFTDFRSFLQMFKLRTLPTENNVAVVVANIEEHLEPCPSGAKIDPSQLKPDWQKLIKESKSKPRSGLLSTVSKASSKHSSLLGKSSNGDDGDDGYMMGEPTPSRDSRRDPILVPSKPPGLFYRLANSFTNSFTNRFTNRFTNSRVNPKNWGWPKKTAGKHKDKRRHNCKTKRKRKFV